MESQSRGRVLRQRCKQHASFLSQRGERKPVHTEGGSSAVFPGSDMVRNPRKQ